MTIASTLARAVVLAAMISGNPAGAANPAPDIRISVPPEMANKPSADTCPALRSGTYRMISPTLGGTLADQTGKAVLDAPTLAITRADGTRGILEADGDCRFTDPGVNGYSVDYVVSQAGVLVGRVTINSGSSYRNIFGFPEQTHALAELAGTWNTLGLRGAAEGFYVDAGSVSYNGAGAATAATECANPATWAIDVCKNVPSSVLEGVKPLAADATGGFVNKSGARTNRLFLYRAAAGQPMLVAISSDGAFFLATPVNAFAMDAVGTTTSRWNLDMSSELASTTSTYVTTSTDMSVDTAKGSWTRQQKTLGLPNQHLETLFANSPRKGYLTRPAGDAPTPGGSIVHFNEFTALRMPGIGVIPVVLPAIKLFEFSVYRP